MHELPASPSDPSQLRAIIDALSLRLADLEAAGAPGPEAAGLEFTDEKLAAIATSIYRARRRRSKLFGNALFSEPAWDMLLDLFIGSIRGRAISAATLCRAADVSGSTGARWIELLAERGLLRRRSVTDEGDLELVELSDYGFDLMRKFVLDGVAKFEMPMPD